MSQIHIALGGERSVSALLTEASGPFAFLVLAHGAGAGMRHHFLQSTTEALARHGVSVLRYQFPYMEGGLKRPDSPTVAQRAVRSAVSAGAEHAGALPLFAGGKSFGGRMTSQAQAAAPLPKVRGLVFFGFPLHPAGKPSVGRADHLYNVRLPMLFLQGSRDALAERDLIEAVVGGLGALATMRIMPDADHSFRVPARSRTDAEVVEDLAQQTASWMREVSKVGARSR